MYGTLVKSLVSNIMNTCETTQLCDVTDWGYKNSALITDIFKFIEVNGPFINVIFKDSV